MSSEPREMESRSISDTVHGTIHMHGPVVKLFDTLEFQRLRNIKQLGLVDRVYPSATHTRFSHSLGAYYFAYQLVKHLKESYPEFGIDDADITAVSVGALFHDIGHGPFSHLFDDAFGEELGERIKHEHISIRIIERVFEKEDIQQAFSPVFGTVGSADWRKNIDFITELIDSEKFNEDNQWLPKGRSVEKAFLYDIVSNSNDGIDVDKWDYLLRDSVSVPYAISFSKSSADRLIQYARPIWVGEGKRRHTRLCYAGKVAEDIRKIGVSRQELHDKVYQHKTVLAMELLLITAMIKAEDIEFKGDDGKMRNLSKVTKNLGAFLRTDDSILTQITNNSKVEDAIRLIDRILKRDQPVLIINKSFSLDNIKKIVEENNLNVNNTSTKHIKLVKKFLEEQLKDLSEGVDYFVVVREIHRGSLLKDPLSKVLFYNHKTKNPGTYILKKDEVALKSSSYAGYYDLVVFCDKSCNKEIRSKIQKKAMEVMKISEPNAFCDANL